MSRYCKICQIILNSDEIPAKKCFNCYSEYVKNNCYNNSSNNKPPTNKINKKCQLAMSYFTNYNSNSEHIYCPYCDEYIMTYSYIVKHVQTSKHALNVTRLNNFIKTYQNKFTINDRQLIKDVLNVNSSFDVI
jgi:hypothetical protein